MPDAHLKRINLAIEFIKANLDRELNLSDLSKLAFYSPFHFHRLFTAIVGESPHQYILRLRIERAAYQLKKDKELNILEIACNNGFESSSGFSKAFKKHYGVSPTVLRNNSSQFSKIRQINSKNGQRLIEISHDIWNVSDLRQMAKNAQVEIKVIPSMKVAFVNHVGAFDGIGKAYGYLLKWARWQNLNPEKLITRFHDSPEVTDLHQIRQSACIEITREPEKSDDILFSTINAGKHAVGRFDIDLKDLDSAWQSMIVWVAEQELVPDEQKTCFEVYSNHFSKKVSENHIVDIYVPLKQKAS